MPLLTSNEGQRCDGLKYLLVHFEQFTQGHLLDLFGHPSGAYRKGGFWMPDFWIISPSQHNKDAIPVDPYGEWPPKIPSERI